MRWILLLALLLAACPTGTRTPDDDDDAGDDDVGDDDAGDDDVGDDDAGDDDVGDDDAGDDDAGDDDGDDGGDDDAADLRPVVAFTEPAGGTRLEYGQTVVLRGTATDPTHESTALVTTFSSDLQGDLATGSPDGAGAVFHTTNALQPGWHDLSLQACNPDALCSTDSLTVGVCDWVANTSFDANLANWTLYGDAEWQGGYIELTGTIADRSGQVFNTSERINPGDVGLRFDIQTGPNSGNGADGFAMSIIDAVDVADLETILASTSDGGGLAYAYGGAYGTIVRDALHVEIDTWHNQYNGTTELHSDPTPDNHIAVTLDGDPGDHILWAAAPSIEDSQWHEVLLKVQGSQVTVTVDGAVALDGPISGWSFRGGYIGFSGSTGYYFNNHRIRDLELLPDCEVP